MITDQKPYIVLMNKILRQQIGGKNADPAEQYHASKIADVWSNHIYQHDAAQRNKIHRIRQIRQFERYLRWKDTPQYIMSNPKGYCFITSSWVAEWEMFIEGWSTEPPETVIDQTSLLASVAQLSSSSTIGAKNPVNIHSADVRFEDDVMVVSKDTWEYLCKHYSVKGQQITQGKVYSFI